MKKENLSKPKPDKSKSLDSIGIFGIPLYGKIPDCEDYIQGSQKWDEGYFKKKLKEDID